MVATLRRFASAASKANRSLMATQRRLDRRGVVLETDIPTRPEDIAQRHHNRFAKEAMRRVLITHHEKRIPVHFTKVAHQKYGYQSRTLKYMKAKARKYHSTTDLIKTGNTRRQMTSAGGRKITIGGAAEGGKKALEGTLTLRFPFPGGTGRFRKEDTHQQVTIQQMNKEIKAITPEERHEIAKQLMKEYWSQVNQFRGKRRRRRKPKF